MNYYISEIAEGYEQKMYELLVDGTPMAEWLHDGNSGVPLYLVNDGLPRWRSRSPDAESNICIVTVCECGEFGCGHSRCRIRRDGKRVVLEDFRGNVGEAGRVLQLEVSAEQFDSVVQQIVTAKKSGLSTK
ncbi:hypothetical protein U5801_17970 [Lamprobacter modestohalophilus]|uniref:hypothetical protein n=1 Tax=Lamprobacter modestohalophilus TaxID=1064514 RepID=UPI002ADEE914|nr:hypothetical protein [Lamprobacter modestohalophilus]MEA1051676.1 hypothetical protein [Lamprobacter modestohalophilus]